jgi:hypothetical protein
MGAAMVILWETQAPAYKQVETLQREIGQSRGETVGLAVPAPKAVRLPGAGGSLPTEKMAAICKQSSVRYKPGVDSIRYIPVTQGITGASFGVVLVEFGQDT